MIYNISKFQQELAEAHIPIWGVSDTGRIDFKPEATEEQRIAAGIIKANHKPIWYKEERQKEYPSIEDQLDMVYWDKINSTSLWIDLITSIKEKYPKD